MTQHIDSPVSARFEVDEERRTITGLAVPYGPSASSNGRLWSFSKGSLTYGDVSRVKVLIGHDFARAVGVVTSLDDQDDGLYMTARIAKGAAGDEALSMAAEGVWDGLSVGLGEGIKARVVDGVNHTVSAPLREISITPVPSFDDARLTSVTASAEGNTMTTNAPETEKVELADPPTYQVSGTLTGEITPVDASTDAQAALQGTTAARFAVAPREFVSAGRPAIKVDEAPAYRFDGVAGVHDFSTDLIAYGRDRDGEAGDRVMRFMAEQFGPAFDVDTGNVSTLNPARNRPDLYVDERRFNTPLYDALHKGAITDSTPFVVPKFNSASALVADHVEGVEPTPGAFTATSQTITPSAVSGKVEITREVWDQGGNPQVSGLIYAKIVQHYYSALEAKAYALLNAASVPGGQVTTVTTGATDDDLVNEIESVIVDLNFVAGGNTFDYAATHANLYKRLAAAVDASGRKLLPQYGPANANGQSRPKFASLDLAGTEFTPVPSLGAASTATGKSYLLDSTSVHVWNSAPQRLEFQYRVAYIDLAVFGYVAAAITDMAGVRRLDYDPTV